MIEFDPSQFQELSNLSPTAKRLVHTVIQRLLDSQNISEDLTLLQQAIAWDPVYNRVPVGIEEFMLSRDYMGLVDPNGMPYINRRIMQLLILCSRPDIRGIYLCLGRNSGKSFFSACMGCWMVYQLVCMRPSPQEALPGIAPGSGIQIINLATNAAQARRSVFEELNIKIDGHHGQPGSPWFQKLGYKKTVGNFKIPSFNIEVVCGHSRAEAWLGANTILGIIDEASHFKESAFDAVDDAGVSTSLAEKNYNSFYGSCRTRFPSHYKLILISSPKHQGDFLFKKIESVRRRGTAINIDTIPLRYRYQPKAKADDVDVERAKLSEYDIGVRAFIDHERFAVQAPTWELRDDETILDYKDDFRDNPNLAARDFGAQPQFATAPYFNFGNLRECLYTGREAPLIFIPRAKGLDTLDLRETPAMQKRRLSTDLVGHADKRYYGHIDFATGGETGRGDACGFALAHLETILLPNDVKDRFVMFDLVTRFQFAENTPVEAEDVCDFVYWLKCGRREFRPPRRVEAWESRDGRGFHNMILSIDGFNYEILKQLLVKRGLLVEYFSPDKNPFAWQEAELAFYQRRVMIYPHPVLEREITALQHTMKGIPDHPPGGSKDILDAVVSVIHFALRDSSISHILRGGYRSRKG